MEAGVRGWVFKSDGTDDLKTAVEALERYECTFSSRVSDLTMTGYLRRYRLGPAAAKVTKLSPREREVLQLLGEGKTSKEVAILRNVKVKTAETHRSNIMLKLNLHSIVERLLYAVRNELVHVQLPAVAALPQLWAWTSEPGPLDLTERFVCLEGFRNAEEVVSHESISQREYRFPSQNPPQTLVKPLLRR